MHDDFHPYYAPYGTEGVVTTDYSKDPETWMVPMKAAAKSSVVEIPGRAFLTLSLCGYFTTRSCLNFDSFSFLELR